MADDSTETAHAKRLSKRQREQERKPLRITDTTLRDAHQSLWATRLRTNDILKILDVMDSAGFYSLEVWGGATFDVCLRFLRENPWERLRQIKAVAKKTPLQMLLRGQNVLGYKNYPDDLLDRFVALACKNGVDIFRIFDALNDTRNLEMAIKTVKKYDGHAQGTICYTISPVHTVEKYVRIAREQVAMGIDSLCIKDMAGFLSPIAAERLITALIRNINVPIQMHCHATSGMAVSTYVEGVRAGAGAIDCAISSMSGFSSQPPVESMISIFDEMPYHANVDTKALRRICKYFEDLAPEYQLSHHPGNIIDPDVLLHHIPGGMISNLRSQLEQQGALDKLDEVLDELPRVRAELGYPPLVTPTSQIIGVQAVMNVLAGERYSMVPQETKNYVKGLYGRSPAPIDPELKKKILDKDRVIHCRPADLLEPMLPNATQNIDPDLIKNEEDIISYCLFPEQAVDYFKWRREPADKRAPIPADVERQKHAVKPTDATVPPSKKLFSPGEYREIHGLIDKIKELHFTEVTIRRDDISLSLKSSHDASVSQGRTAHAKASDGRVSEAVRQDAAKPGPGDSEPKAGNVHPSAPPPKTSEPAAVSGPTINAPLNGTYYGTDGPGKPQFIKEGDQVRAGQPVCIVEAMKLFNHIKAPFDCTVVRILAEHGKSVQKGQPLILVEKR